MNDFDDATRPADATTAARDVPSALAGSIDRYGPGLFYEPDRLKLLLQQECPDATREISLLLLALADEVPQRLLAAHGGDDLRSLMSQLVDRLGRNPLFDRTSAVRTVRTWAGALAMPSTGVESTDLPRAKRPSAPIDFGFVVTPLSSGSRTNAADRAPPSVSRYGIDERPGRTPPASAKPQSSTPIATSPREEPPPASPPQPASADAATAVERPQTSAPTIDPIVVAAPVPPEASVAAPEATDDDRPAVVAALPEATAAPIHTGPLASIEAGPEPVEPLAGTLSSSSSSSSVSTSPRGEPARMFEADGDHAPARDPNSIDASSSFRGTAPLGAASTTASAADPDERGADTRAAEAAAGSLTPAPIEIATAPTRTSDGRVPPSTTPLAGAPPRRAARGPIAVAAIVAIIVIGGLLLQRATRDDAPIGTRGASTSADATQPSTPDVAATAASVTSPGEPAPTQSPARVDVASTASSQPRPYERGDVAATTGAAAPSVAVAPPVDTTVVPPAADAAPSRRVAEPRPAPPARSTVVAAPAIIRVDTPRIANGKPFAVAVAITGKPSDLVGVERRVVAGEGVREAPVTTPLAALKVTPGGSLLVPFRPLDAGAQSTVQLILIARSGARSAPRNVTIRASDVESPLLASPPSLPLAKCTYSTCGSVVSVSPSEATGHESIVRMDDRSIQVVRPGVRWRVGSRVQRIGNRYVTMASP